MQELDFSEFSQLRLDLLIDARSPLEFAHSHIKGALNFYALDDAQREYIGTLYKQNQSQAKLLGAKMICSNMSSHIENIAKAAKVGSMVGIYCARGGLRSKSIAMILEPIGYRVVRLNSGFKGYRSYLSEFFSKKPEFSIFALCGNTGCAKTELLELLPCSIDLEGLSNHLGSSFGNINGAQPTQKAFDDALFHAMKVVKDFAFIELESHKIGEIVVPKSLYQAMQDSTKILCTASLESRISRLVKSYAKKLTPELFYANLERISPYISHELKLELKKSFEAGDFALCAELLLGYYDKVYKKPQNAKFIVNTDNLQKARDEILDFASSSGFGRTHI